MHAYIKIIVPLSMQVIPEYKSALEVVWKEKLSIVLHLKQSVMKIDHASLTELRAQPRPPQLIEDLLAAIISILKSPTADLTWMKGAKRLMANADRFRELLLEKSDSEDNSETILQSVETIFDRSNLTMDRLGHCPGGLAATQLLEWVQDIVKLHTLLQSKERPLQARLDAMSASLLEYKDRLRLEEEKMQVCTCIHIYLYSCM